MNKSEIILAAAQERAAALGLQLRVVTLESLSADECDRRERQATAAAMSPVWVDEVSPWDEAQWAEIMAATS